MIGVISMQKPVGHYNCSRVAVLSDIHSNYLALKACFEDARKENADFFVFLGDYVSGLSETVMTMELIYEIQSRYKTVCLRGNRERYMLDHRTGLVCLKRNLHDRSYLYTYERLTEKDVAFFTSIPFYDVIQINDTMLELTHATKSSDRFYFEKDDPQIDSVFSEMSAPFLLTGHSHRPYLQRKGHKTIINPGSVGLPQGNGGLAQYALLDIDRGTVDCTFRAVDYDRKQLIHQQFSSGLIAYAKYWAISDLYNAITGKEYTKWLLDFVYADEKKTPNIIDDESAWLRYTKELGMHLTEPEIVKSITGEFSGVWGDKLC